MDDIILIGALDDEDGRTIAVYLDHGMVRLDVPEAGRIYLSPRANVRLMTYLAKGHEDADEYRLMKSLAEEEDDDA